VRGEAEAFISSTFTLPSYFMARSMMIDSSFLPWTQLDPRMSSLTGRADFKTSTSNLASLTETALTFPWKMRLPLAFG